MAEPDPRNPGDRAKAFRLRKARDANTIGTVDRLWLDDYESVQQGNGPRAKGSQAPPPRSKNFGRSRSARKMKFEVEEAAEAEGTGNAARDAVAHALQSREEGRRVDNLSMGAVDALREACAVYKDICLTLKERAEVLEATHIEMLHTVRTHYLHATQIEAALQRAQQEAPGDPAIDMISLLVAKHLGVPLDQLRGPAAAAAAAAEKKRPPPPGANGTHK